MSSEKFCLRWNDFETNISVAFRELRDDKDFFDVTLACDDDQIQAHKVILSACSPFFRNILRRNPHQHPLLYLKNVRFTDLQSVLNFMYHGEVNVAQEELNSFLSVAEELRVKGLTQNSGGAAQSAAIPSKTPNETTRSAPSQNIPKPRPAPIPMTSTPTPIQPAKRPRPAVNLEDDDDIQEVVPVKTEPREMHQSNTISQQSNQPLISHQEEMADTSQDDGMEGALQQYGAEEESYEDYGEYGDQGYGVDQNMAAAAVQDGNKGPEFLNKHIIKVTDGSNAQFQCTLCGKNHRQKIHAQNHVESLHFPEMFVYNCQYCNLSFNGRNKFYVHNSKFHKSK